MDRSLLIAAVEHGPGMHGGLVIVLFAIAVVGGLLYLVKNRRRSGRRADASDSREARDVDAEANDRNPAA